MVVIVGIQVMVVERVTQMLCSQKHIQGVSTIAICISVTTGGVTGMTLVVGVITSRLLNNQRRCCVDKFVKKAQPELILYLSLTGAEDDKGERIYARDDVCP